MLKYKWPSFFLSIQKFGRWMTLFGSITVSTSSWHVNKFCIIYKIKESFHPSYQSIVCFASLLFRSIYIDKTKVDIVDVIFTTTKTLYADFVSHFIYLDILRHKREIPFSPRIVLILMYRYCVHVHQFILFVWGTTLYICMSALPFGYVFLQYIL